LARVHDVAAIPFDRWDAEAIVRTHAIGSVNAVEEEYCCRQLRISSSLVLIEVGAAAGLCLVPDRHG
jgi:hypothetical protein